MHAVLSIENGVFVLDDEDLDQVSGGGGPILLAAALGAAGGALNAYAGNGDYLRQTVIGATSGVLFGIGGAVYTASRVGGLYFSSLGLGVQAAGAGGGKSFDPRPIAPQ